jgi:hypothetical protein
VPHAAVVVLLVVAGAAVVFRRPLSRGLAQDGQFQPFGASAARVGELVLLVVGLLTIAYCILVLAGVLPAALGWPTRW